MATIAPAGARAYGGMVHVVQIVVGGWTAYRLAPTCLAMCLTLLTVFDPWAARLLVQR